MRRTGFASLRTPYPVPHTPILAKKLVIVESPAKSRTVGRFLGSGYTVKASIGHIRDLPVNRMGVDIENDFAPHYVIPEKKKDVVKGLKAEAKEAAEIFLATDPDREGEAISWHLREALSTSIKDKPVHRVVFHEITKGAIDEAFAHAREIDGNLVDAVMRFADARFAASMPFPANNISGTRSTHAL